MKLIELLDELLGENYEKADVIVIALSSLVVLVQIQNWMMS